MMPVATVELWKRQMEQAGAKVLVCERPFCVVDGLVLDEWDGSTSDTM